MKKLENLVSFDDFKSNWKSDQSKKTSRTETGLDILKEGIDEDGVEEIISEGLPHEDIDYSKMSKYGMSNEEQIEKIKNLVDSADEGYIDELVNYLRDVLLEMEQEGFIDEDTTDNLDDEHDGDWASWIKDVIELPDFPEDALNGILDIINEEDQEDLELEDEDLELEDEEEDFDEDEIDDNISYS